MIGKLIGKGDTADVFDIGNNKVVKLFKKDYPLNSVQNEFENSNLLNELEINIAKSYKLVKCRGRHGIIYDRINGISMMDLLLETKDFGKYAVDLALLHKIILSHKLESAVSLKSILKNNIENTDKLSMKCKSKLIVILDTLPDGNCFCHGDYHFGNILVNQEAYYIIDYMNVCRGHKYGDIARTVYLIGMTPTPSEIQNHDIERFLYMKEQIINIYLKEMGVDRECLLDWLMITAAARLSELDDVQTDEINSILEYLSVCKLDV